MEANMVETLSSRMEMDESHNNKVCSEVGFDNCENFDYLTKVNDLEFVKDNLSDLSSLREIDDLAKIGFFDSISTREMSHRSSIFESEGSTLGHAQGWYMDSNFTLNADNLNKNSEKRLEESDIDFLRRKSNYVDLGHSSILVARTMSPEKLAELARTNPKKANRILANRNSAAKSKERRKIYENELENKVKNLQAQVDSVSEQLLLTKRGITIRSAWNNTLKMQIEAKRQELQQRRAPYEALRTEHGCDPNPPSQHQVSLQPQLSPHPLPPSLPFGHSIGRRSDFFNINCNDEGAIYMEASVNFTIEEFINPPKLELLNKLLPCEPNKTQPFQQVLPQLLIQVNVFKCGGIAISLCNLHTMLDASSCCAFLKTWSSICKGLPKDEISQPDFSSASSFFPPRNISGVRDGVLNPKPGLNKERMCTTTRFLFNTNAINELRAKSENDGTSSKNTRYQVLSTFISKHMGMACMEESSYDSPRPVVVVHVVDIRRRIGEPFSQDSIGNLLWPTVLNCDKINMNTHVRDLVRIMKEEIGKYTKEMFLKMQSDQRFLWSDECAELMHEGLVEKDPIVFVFTSWVNMGFNELDFGWGKPLWLALRGGPQETMANATVFTETNEGIEAWVTMEEKTMAILENDVDFLKFALLNPNSINI
ncbi:unnamed protein product [Lupinus luteus]|uniref:BZIP domain-containing protein n=1 Tax=Lupinus luteus TaxID=3873 RepID=A0AAV1W1R4_LUPLU